jgi:hypothetical protein
MTTATTFGALPPNWVDRDMEFDGKSAKEVLQIIAKNPEMIATVEAAIAQDKKDRENGIMGPSLSQRIRLDIAEKLNSQE